jgi:predicted AAA+ superfamily ATPase
MPKIDLLLNPGDELPIKLQTILQDYFSDKDFEKLLKFGGRVQISITAPFTDRKEQDNKLIIDDAYIANLKINPSISDETLKTLTKKQLVKVATLLNFPTTAKATTKEIKKTINDHLNSSKKWDKISGA